MSSTTSTATPSRHGFEQSVEEVKISKSDLNRVIMEYLVREGYPAAAQKFAAEANMPVKPDYEAMQARVSIRNDIFAGNIQTAIEKINEVAPQVLDENRLLHFALLRLQLIEMIRENLSTNPTGDPNPIFEFAATNLAPRAQQQDKTQEDLEHTMSLMFFPGEKPPEIAYQFDSKIRRDTATRVNEALLGAYNSRTKTTLAELVNHRAWAEKMGTILKKITPEDPVALNLDPTPQDDPSPSNNGVSQHNGSSTGDAMAIGWGAQD